MQKFLPGDLVLLNNKESNPIILHENVEAIVKGSYSYLYGGNSEHSQSQYSLYVKGSGESAWHRETDLTLIEHNKFDLLENWKQAAEEIKKQKSDIDWIFKNGEEVIKNPDGNSIQTLASCFGLTNLWGNRGEGFIYVQNAQMTLHLAKPFLEKNDKNGWLTFAKTLKTEYEKSNNTK